jgi:hypothetical protein
VEWTRRRHLAFRERLSETPIEEPSGAFAVNAEAKAAPRRSLSVVSAGL